MKTDYYTVTEVPNSQATQDQLTRLSHRYETAARYCKGKRVLEVACGAGQGLGLLARSAERVIGGDYSERLLQCARAHYGDRMELVRFDAQSMPFANASFEVVLLFEAIYYLAAPERFIKESKRVLRKGGILIICTVNKDWSDFNPSPFSQRYYSAPELMALAGAEDFETELFAAFSDTPGSVKAGIVSLLKRIAVALHLMPKTMKGKAFLKRIFFGKLQPIPAELHEGMAEHETPIRISGVTADSRHKILYALARSR
jgi:SAM-dependent methyltransferase